MPQMAAPASVPPMATRHHETLSLVPIATKAAIRTRIGIKNEKAVKPLE